MEAVKNNKEERMDSAEKLAQMIASIPDTKRTLAVAIMNAYADGLIAGQGLSMEVANAEVAR